MDNTGEQVNAVMHSLFRQLLRTDLTERTDP